MEAFMKNWNKARKGLPDLVVFESDPQNTSQENLIRFIEVKGPGDRLSDAQIWWLHKLNDSGIAAEVWSVSRPAH